MSFDRNTVLTGPGGPGGPTSPCKCNRNIISITTQVPDRERERKTDSEKKAIEKQAQL